MTKETRQVRNITVDADIQEKLSKLQDHLEARLGFRPTISQTLRHLIKLSGDALE